MSPCTGDCCARRGPTGSTSRACSLSGCLASPIALLNPCRSRSSSTRCSGRRRSPRRSRVAAGDHCGIPRCPPRRRGRPPPRGRRSRSAPGARQQVHAGPRRRAAGAGFRPSWCRQAQRLSLSYHDSKGACRFAVPHSAGRGGDRQDHGRGIIPFITAAITPGHHDRVTAGWTGSGAGGAPQCPHRCSCSRAFIAPHAAPAPPHQEARELRARGRPGDARCPPRREAFGGEQAQTDRFAQRSREGVAARIHIAPDGRTLRALVGLTTALGTGAVLFIGVPARPGQPPDPGPTVDGGDLLGATVRAAEDGQQRSGDPPVLPRERERAFALLDDSRSAGARGRSAHRSRRRPLAFRQVCFAYGPDRPVLHDVSFEIAPGTRLGIVGATGAGKTTLISLLTRSTIPATERSCSTGGSARLQAGGLAAQVRRRAPGPVLSPLDRRQHRPSAPARAGSTSVAAAQAANAHEFIERLPQGYDTQVGERV